MAAVVNYSSHLKGDQRLLTITDMFDCFGSCEKRTCFLGEFKEDNDASPSESRTHSILYADDGTSSAAQHPLVPSISRTRIRLDRVYCWLG